MRPAAATAAVLCSIKLRRRSSSVKDPTGCFPLLRQLGTREEGKLQTAVVQLRNDFGGKLRGGFITASRQVTFVSENERHRRVRRRPEKVDTQIIFEEEACLSHEQVRCAPRAH